MILIEDTQSYLIYKEEIDENSYYEYYVQKDVGYFSYILTKIIKYKNNHIEFAVEATVGSYEGNYSGEIYNEIKVNNIEGKRKIAYKYGRVREDTITLQDGKIFHKSSSSFIDDGGIAYVGPLTEDSLVSVFYQKERLFRLNKEKKSAKVRIQKKLF